MPTYYPPGKRRGYPFFVIRGYIDGKRHESRSKTTYKKGPGGAEEFWERFKLRIWAERGADPTRETATLDDAVALLLRQIPETLGP